MMEIWIQMMAVIIHATLSLTGFVMGLIRLHAMSVVMVC